MGTTHQALMAYGDGGSGGGAPSASDIQFMGNAEIEAGALDILSGNSGVTLESGITGADGRVYGNFTASGSFTLDTDEEFVSAGCRQQVTVDTDGGLLSFSRSDGLVHLRIERHTDDTWRVVHGDGTVLASGTTTLSIDTWYRFVLYARVHDTLGEFTAKLYDASDSLLETLSGSGVDTMRGTASTTVKFVNFGSGAANSYTDELWVDITGELQDAARVITLSPNAAGDLAQLSRGGTDTGANFSQVNEVPKNTTSYVFSTAADQYDVHKHPSVGISGEVIAVHQVFYARAHTAGTRDFKAAIRIGGVNFDGANTFSRTSTTSDTVSIERWQNNPATGNQWQASDFGASGAQFGYKSVTTDIRIQTECLHVLVKL